MTAYILTVDDAALVEIGLGGILRHDPAARRISSASLGDILVTSSKDGAALAKMFGCSDHPQSRHVVERAKHQSLSIGELIDRGLT